MTEVHHEDRARDLGRVVRLVVAALIVVAIVAVALDNTDEVDVGYVFGDVSAPLWLVLVAAGIAGLLVGWLIKHRPRHRH
jgi:uncharacterized integral membrane protein